MPGCRSPAWIHQTSLMAPLDLDEVRKALGEGRLDALYYSCRFTVSARLYVFRDGHAAVCGYVSGCWGWRLD